MAGISAKGYYAISCMYHLSLAKDTPYLQAKELAARIETSPAFMEQILVLLKKSGLVQSVQGAKGGFLLAKPASRITLLEILQCVDESLLRVKKSTQPNLVLDNFWDDIYEKSKALFVLPLSELTAQYQPFFYDI